MKICDVNDREQARAGFRKYFNVGINGIYDVLLSAATGCVKTESGKRSISPGQKFMPLNNDLQFTYIGYANPMFEIIKDK